MDNYIIKAENISKQYRLGLVGTGTLSHDLNRWWHNVRGLEDPYLKVGEMNDRSKKGASDYVWALKNINFEVEKGEILGIIGKNGAGKSTLLKILSRVTAPTTGKITAHGRIASLLEVGTGFHPELTGRENIFLNGAILGMTKKEIKAKFDEIVDFAGCERYVDTPVKRYSSGMYVRLAFAVAAHLEPEILVVDEVLAVGDAEFQKKAVGKMKDVSENEGRTVLFVSHNMASVKALCNRGLIIQNGSVVFDGGMTEAIDIYKHENIASIERKKINFPLINQAYKVELRGIEMRETEADIEVDFTFFSEVHQNKIGIGVMLHTSDGTLLSRIGEVDSNTIIYNFKGEKKVTIILEDILRKLNNGRYTLSFWISIPSVHTIFKIKDFDSFEIADFDYYQTGVALNHKHHGYFPMDITLKE